MFFFFAGELEKQQGAKALSVKSNGTKLELLSKQGSLSGMCIRKSGVIKKKKAEGTDQPPACNIDVQVGDLCLNIYILFFKEFRIF